jgi:hypothetical protein
MKKFNTKFTSQVAVYLGKDGLILYTPLTNLFTKLCFPIGKLSTLIMVDKAEIYQKEQFRLL